MIHPKNINFIIHGLCDIPSVKSPTSQFSADGYSIFNSTCIGLKYFFEFRITEINKSPKDTQETNPKTSRIGEFIFFCDPKGDGINLSSNAIPAIYLIRAHLKKGKLKSHPNLRDDYFRGWLPR